MAKTSAERVAAYRARQREVGEPDTSRRNRKTHKAAHRARTIGARPFIGCDGEGAGVDALGRQNYLLFRMGERELYDGGRRLTTWDLLDFICDQPAGGILVGFAFGYDVTMILRDLPPDQQKRLFAPKVFGEGHSPFVWYKDFDIDYLPRQYLKVRRVTVTKDPETGKEKRIGVKGSTRIIYETFGFFQKSFLKVIEEFKVGTPEQRAMIAANKNARSDFTEMTQEVRAYCALECEFLAELMGLLRQYCADAGIVPRTWSGAGKLAKAMLAAHEMPKAAEFADWVPAEVMDLANMAYYGGRFEITRTGLIDQPVWESDIRSAYPDAMRRLPCLEHARWEKADGKVLAKHKGLSICAVSFSKAVPEPDRFGVLGALPVRSREGHLYWPLRGSGIYWSPEIESAERLGFTCKRKGGWIHHKTCDCVPFDWIEPVYDYRRQIGSSGPGYPIKLGINSLYGVQAQRKGNGQYSNMVWAGLTTSFTRAKLNDAIALAPDKIVMVATDAVYSLAELPLETGERLGEWETVQLNGLFIVQPGLYWDPSKRKRKSRGLSGKFFEEAGRTESFEQAWQDFRTGETRDRSGDVPDAAETDDLVEPEFPSVAVPVPGFIGLRLAIARGKPELSGRWISDTRKISFDYRNKRAAHRWDGQAVVTAIKAGSSGLQSLPHREFLAAGGAGPWEDARLMLDEQPDYVDLGIPFKD